MTAAICTGQDLPSIVRPAPSHGLRGDPANHHLVILSSALKSARPTKYRRANINGIQNLSSAHICSRGIGGSSEESSAGAWSAFAGRLLCGSRSSWTENHFGRISSDLLGRSTSEIRLEGRKRNFIRTLLPCPYTHMRGRRQC